MDKQENKTAYIDLYKAFRKELDEMCIPLIIDELRRIEPIKADGKIVGMVGGFTDYIDCVYVKPEYRRKGLAKQAVLKFVEGNLNYGIRLHIINDNDIAYKFWSNLFELKEIACNEVDCYIGEGKVIGEFVCDKKDFFFADYYDNGSADLTPSRLIFGLGNANSELAYLDKCCLTHDELFDYITSGKYGYGWHITDLKIYDKPKELSEFNLTRPPQSWCYVEVGE